MAFSAPDTDISPLKHGFSVPESDLPNGCFHAPQSDLWNIDPGTKLGIPTEFSGGEENKFSPDNPDAAFTRATEADPTLALAGQAVGAIQTGLIEPAAAQLMNLAMFNLPAQPGEDSVAPEMPPLQPGVPLIPPPDGKGILPALGRFASSFTTPGQLVTLPFLPESKLIKGFFATGAAAGIQPALEKFEQSQTPEDRNDAATELGLSVGMAAYLGHGLGIFTKKADLAAIIADLKSKIDAILLTKPPGEAVQPSEAPPGVQTPPAAETPPGSSQAPPQSSSKVPVFDVVPSGSKFVITRNGEEMDGTFNDPEMARFAADAMNRGVAEKPTTSTTGEATQNLGSPEGANAAVKEVENPTSQGKPTEKPLDTPASATDKAADPAEAKPQTELPGTETPISPGPGAAANGEPGTYPPIQQMTDYLKATAEKTPDIDSKVGLIDRAKLFFSDAKDALKALYARLNAVKDVLWDRYKAAPPLRDDNMAAVGKWFRALQQAAQIARNFAKQIVIEVPDKLRREAITNWIQAEGDEALLNERADASTGRIAAGYRIATKLTPREKEIAGMLRDYYDHQLEIGLREGLIKHYLQNYITQVWERDNPIAQKLVSDLCFGKLTPNFKYARKRIFDSYFEGEQAGYTPNKDAGFLVANYDQTFNRALAARAFIKDLHEGKASDGRPLVELSGEGHPIEDEHGGGSILVNPHAKPEDIGDYRMIDHPALRGWKWLMKTDDGKSVFVRGNMLVHPEIYDRLKNRLTTSWFQSNPVARDLMAAQTSLKQTLFSVPGFHQVQETLHALGHRIDPTNLEEVDFSDPVTKGLAEHGLQLADYNALAHFSEGLAGGGLVNKLPYVGPKLHAYNEWLFQDHIPKLKLAVAKISLERNRETYPKWNEDQQLSAAASIANDAFGELPYRYWGSNPNMIDAFRAFLLAPDFAASRARFVARALRPGGREQLTAIGVLALTQYTTARAVNQALNGDAHWEPQNMFRIIYKNHAYSLRTIPSDLLHMFNEPRGFFSNRMSLASRAAFESITGRDYRGVKRDFAEQVKDMLTSAMPISVKPLAGQKWWQAAMNNFGVQDQRWDAVQTLNARVQAWKAKNPTKSPADIVYDADNDHYAPLKRAVEDDDQAAAKKEYAKLVASTPPKVIPRKSGDITESPEDQVQQHFKLSYNRPFTGSKAYDEQFLQSLDATGKQEYQEASDLRQARFKMIQSLRQ